MTKRELITLVAEKLGYTQQEVTNVVQATLDTIIECLAEGKRIEIRNFGVFEVKTRDARMGRNPRTGEEVPISEKRIATFKPGKALKEFVRTGKWVPEELEEEDFPTALPFVEETSPATGSSPSFRTPRGSSDENPSLD